MEVILHISQLFLTFKYLLYYPIPSTEQAIKCKGGEKKTTYHLLKTKELIIAGCVWCFLITSELNTQGEILLLRWCYGGRLLLLLNVSANINFLRKICKTIDVSKNFTLVG